MKKNIAAEDRPDFTLMKLSGAISYFHMQMPRWLFCDPRYMDMGLELSLIHILLVEKIAGLAQMPERCPQLNDLALRAKGYRYLLVKNYLVFFVVAGDTVQIRRVLYARRDYRALL